VHARHELQCTTMSRRRAPALPHTAVPGVVPFRLAIPEISEESYIFWLCLQNPRFHMSFCKEVEHAVFCKARSECKTFAEAPM